MAVAEIWENRGKTAFDQLVIVTYGFRQKGATVEVRNRLPFSTSRLSFVGAISGCSAMQMIAPLVPTLAVATIYCLWFRALMTHSRRQRALRERVAYMLWCTANESEFA